MYETNNGRNNRIIILILQRENFAQKPEIENHTASPSSILNYIYLTEK